MPLIVGGVTIPETATVKVVSKGKLLGEPNFIKDKIGKIIWRKAIRHNILKTSFNYPHSQNGFSIGNPGSQRYTITHDTIDCLGWQPPHPIQPNYLYHFKIGTADCTFRAHGTANSATFTCTAGYVDCPILHYHQQPFTVKASNFDYGHSQNGFQIQNPSSQRYILTHNDVPCLWQPPHPIQPRHLYSFNIGTSKATFIAQGTSNAATFTCTDGHGECTITT